MVAFSLGGGRGYFDVVCQDRGAACFEEGVVRSPGPAPPARALPWRSPARTNAPTGARPWRPPARASDPAHAFCTGVQRPGQEPPACAPPWRPPAWTERSAVASPTSPRRGAQKNLNLLCNCSLACSVDGSSRGSGQNRASGVKGARAGRGEAGLDVAGQGEAGGCPTQETLNRDPQGQRCWHQSR